MYRNTAKANIRDTSIIVFTGERTDADQRIATSVGKPDFLATVHVASDSRNKAGLDCMTSRQFALARSHHIISEGDERQENKLTCFGLSCVGDRSLCRRRQDIDQNSRELWHLYSAALEPAVLPNWKRSEPRPGCSGRKLGAVDVVFRSNCKFGLLLVSFCTQIAPRGPTKLRCHTREASHSNIRRTFNYDRCDCVRGLARDLFYVVAPVRPSPLTPKKSERLSEIWVVAVKCSLVSQHRVE